MALPQSRFTSAYIVSGDGTMFGSTDETEMGSPSPIKGNALVQKALLRRSPSGFIPEFTDRNRRQKIGSFAQVPGAVPLYVIVERDRNAAFQVITKMYFTATLWGAMIILIAILVSVISANSITKHLVSLVEITKRIAAGDFTSRAQGDSTDEVGELRKSVNHMAERIGGLMVSEVEKARFEKELETARMVQSTFFPKTNVNTSYLSVTGSYQPATECGGDLWGHYTVRKNVELVFIADAMGHGAPAALVTAIAYAVCQSIAGILKDNENVDNTPGKLLKRLNDIIMEAVDGKISMTFFAALFDFNTGKIVYANAGHNYPFVLTSNKSDPRLGKTTKKSQPDIQSWPITLTLQGNPLGVSREMEYNEKSIDMVAGDKIFFYTDGLIENHFDENKPLGRKGLVEAVSKMGSSSIDQIKTGIQQTGCDIYGDKNLQDDVTIVVAEISPSWVKQELSSSTPSAESTPLVIDLDFAGLTNEPKNASGI